MSVNSLTDVKVGFPTKDYIVHRSTSNKPYGICVTKEVNVVLVLLILLIKEHNFKIEKKEFAQ